MNSLKKIFLLVLKITYSTYSFVREPFDHRFIKLTQCLDRKAVLHIILKGLNLAHDQRVRRQYAIPFINDINFIELMIKKFFVKITIVELMS